MTKKSGNQAVRRLRLFGAAVIALMMVYGVFAKMSGSPAKMGTKTPLAPDTTAWQLAEEFKVRAGLSQTKVLQGGDGTVYLKIDLEADEGEKSAPQRRPTDFIVVLDRSGSMMEAGKMNYAHQAIESLIRQMTPDDRFALVSFDDYSENPIPLTRVTRENADILVRQAKAIQPRGGTNIGAGLQDGIRLIKTARDSGRSAKRLILLSDGLANVGIVDENELGKIAAQAVPGEFVVSTVGLGLDFNERLMSGLADHGTGNYHFLESTAALDAVLSKEFFGASDVVAEALELSFDPMPGVRVTDASGYPVDSQSDGRIIVRPGQLYSKQKKSLFLTLVLPTGSTYSDELGRATLSYKNKSGRHELALLPEDLVVACVPRERQDEMTASINKPVYEEVWTQNNFGRTLQSTSASVAAGDKEGALQAIDDYAKKLEVAYDQAPSPALQQKISELAEEKDEVNKAFADPSGADAVKRLAKSKQATGAGFQRGQNK